MAIGQFFGGVVVGSDRPQTRRLHRAQRCTSSPVHRDRFRGTASTQMLALRFFQAIGGGFSTVICMATVRDVYPVEQLGRRFATRHDGVLVAPLVAPTLGTRGVAARLGDDLLSRRRPTRRCLLVAYTRARARDASRPARQSVAALDVPAVLRGRARSASTAGCCRFATRSAMAFSASVLMIFVTNASFIYMEYFGVSRRARSRMLFGLSVLGFMSMNLFSMWRLERAQRRERSSGSGSRSRCCAVAGLVDRGASGHASLPDRRAVHRPDASRRSASSDLRARRATWAFSASSQAARRRFTRR